jgi:hypothetical protein
MKFDVAGHSEIKQQEPDTTEQQKQSSTQPPLPENAKMDLFLAASEAEKKISEDTMRVASQHPADEAMGIEQAQHPVGFVSVASSSPTESDSAPSAAAAAQVEADQQATAASLPPSFFMDLGVDDAAAVANPSELIAALHRARALNAQLERRYELVKARFDDVQTLVEEVTSRADQEPPEVLLQIKTILDEAASRDHAMQNDLSIEDEDMDAPAGPPTLRPMPPSERLQPPPLVRQAAATSAGGIVGRAEPLGKQRSKKASSAQRTPVMAVAAHPGIAAEQENAAMMLLGGLAGAADMFNGETAPPPHLFAPQAAASTSAAGPVDRKSVLHTTSRVRRDAALHSYGTRPRNKTAVFQYEPSPSPSETTEDDEPGMLGAAPMATGEMSATALFAPTVLPPSSMAPMMPLRRPSLKRSRDDEGGDGGEDDDASEYDEADAAREGDDDDEDEDEEELNELDDLDEDEDFTTSNRPGRVRIRNRSKAARAAAAAAAGAGGQQLLDGSTPLLTPTSPAHSVSSAGSTAQQQLLARKRAMALEGRHAMTSISTHISRYPLMTVYIKVAQCWTVVSHTSRPLDRTRTNTNIAARRRSRSLSRFFSL